MAGGELAAGDEGAEKSGGVSVGKDMMGQREWSMNGGHEKVADKVGLCCSGLRLRNLRCCRC